MASEMTPSRPYLVRGLYEWILDNGLTPYILVNADAEEVAVPRDFVKDGHIVLNVAPTAVRQLEMSNEALAFSARFGGQPMDVYCPIMAVMAVYAKENGRGMFFDPEETGPEPPSPGSDASDKDAGKGDGGDKGDKKKGPNLSVIK